MKTQKSRQTCRYCARLGGSKTLNSLTAKDSHDRPLFNELLCWLVTSTIFVHWERLIARKLVVLFGFHHGILPFYVAHCFYEVSRGSVLCLLNNSFGTAISQRHNSIFYAKIDDHGVSRGDTGQILARWQRPVASKVALDLAYWAMRLTPYHLICMAIEMASEVGTCFSVVDFMSCITVAKRPCYGPLKIKLSYNIFRYYILI